MKNIILKITFSGITKMNDVSELSNLVNQINCIDQSASLANEIKGNNFVSYIQMPSSLEEKNIKKIKLASKCFPALKVASVCQLTKSDIETLESRL